MDSGDGWLVLLPSFCSGAGFPSDAGVFFGLSFGVVYGVVSGFGSVGGLCPGDLDGASFCGWPSKDIFGSWLVRGGAAVFPAFAASSAACAPCGRGSAAAHRKTRNRMTRSLCTDERMDLNELRQNCRKVGEGNLVRAVTERL